MAELTGRLRRQARRLTDHARRFGPPAAHPSSKRSTPLPRRSCDVTVYRSLHLLGELKAVHRFDFGDGVARFRLLPEGDDGHHHHLVRRGCSRVIESTTAFSGTTAAGPGKRLHRAHAPLAVFRRLPGLPATSPLPPHLTDHLPDGAGPAPSGFSSRTGGRHGSRDRMGYCPVPPVKKRGRPQVPPILDSRAWRDPSAWFPESAGRTPSPIVKAAVADQVCSICTGAPVFDGLCRTPFTLIPRACASVVETQHVKHEPNQVHEPPSPCLPLGSLSLLAARPRRKSP
jgi:Fur family ferric uptake transcriptional regulator